MRLVFLDIGSKQEQLPDRFQYIGQPWLYMFRTENYSEEECIEYLQKNPHYNLLLSNTGVDQIAVHDDERHLKHIKDQKVDSHKENAEEKRQQSQRAKEKNEAKRKKRNRLQRSDRVHQRKAPLPRLPKPLRK